MTPGYHTIRVAYVDGLFYVDAFIVNGLATATPTATAYTPSPTPSRTNTPVPSNTATFTPTATAVPTATTTPIPSEPAPQALTSAEYAYDGDGTMMRGTVNGLTTFYPGRHYNKEVSLDGTKIQKFYFAGTITIAVRTLTDTADTLTWVLSDHLGSASTTANQDGTLNSVIQYTAFGEIRLTQGLTPTKYRYTGQLAQAELGLDFYVSRMYDPLTAHFTTADTLIPEPGKSQSWDRYAYVFNNPKMNIDPTGHVCIQYVGDFCVAYSNDSEDFPPLSIDLMGFLTAFLGGEDNAGIMKAEAAMGGKSGSIEVAAGLAIQGEFAGFFDDLASKFSKSSGVGLAQTNSKEINNFGLSGSPYDTSVAVKVMESRIYVAQNACNDCSSEDLLIIAALAQNSPNGSVDVKGYQEAYGKFSGLGYLSESSSSNPQYDMQMRLDVVGLSYKQFMVLKYIKDLRALHKRGWEYPEGINDKVLNELELEVENVRNRK